MLDARIEPRLRRNKLEIQNQKYGKDKLKNENLN